MTYRAITRGWAFVGAVGALGCAQVARFPSPYAAEMEAAGALPRQLDRTLHGFARQGFSGTALVAAGNRVLLYRGYGQANRARQIPNTAETKYPLGAVANQFTAALILALENEGKLSTRDQATRYLGPDAPALTIEALLRRSGEVEGVLAGPASLSGSSAAPPAERFVTPGESYQVLAQIIEKVTGDSQYAALRRTVLLPNGLTRTLYDDGRLDDSLVARGYQSDDGATILAHGLVAPLADLWRWHQAVKSGTAMSASQRERMFRPGANGYGLGVVVGRTVTGERLIEQASDEPGFQLWYAWLPERDILIVLAVNTDGGWRQPVADQLVQLVTTGANADLAVVTPPRRATLHY